METSVKAIPPKDTRVKTEDVTNTKGLTFKSFNLDKNLELVQIIDC